ncbi:MAG: DNA polymerase III subunit delta [Clostridia bacterium]|nr:DNA polymerase III subunit delta [Clostridia bacterium]
MELNDFKVKIKSGDIVGSYIFSGEEDYLKRFYLGELRSAAVSDDTFSAFNYAVYDGEEVDFASIRDDIMSPPMFEPYKMIEWRYPSFDKMKESELEELERLVDLVAETDYAVLAFLVSEGDIDLGTPKKESKFAKRFREKIRILNFDKCTDAQLLSWLKRHFDAEGVEVTREVLDALVFRAGHSMTVLNNEVTKLCMLAKSRSQPGVSVADVELVASSTPECDTFALSNAIIERNKRGAFIALEEMKSRRLDPIMILGMMAKTYTDIVTVSMMLGDGINSADIQTATRMNPYRLGLYLGAAKRYPPERANAILTELARVDTGAKYGGVTGYTAIEMFIAKCL